MQITLKDHSNRLMTKYIQEYIKGEELDCILVCDGQNIKCHRFILKTYSSYFQQTFDNEIIIEHFSHRVPPFIFLIVNLTYTHLKRLVDFMYFGKIDIKGQDLESILEAAGTLGLDGIDFDIDSESSNLPSIASQGSNGSQKWNLNQVFEPPNFKFSANNNTIPSNLTSNNGETIKPFILDPLSSKHPQPISVAQNTRLPSQPCEESLREDSPRDDNDFNSPPSTDDISEDDIPIKSYSNQDVSKKDNRSALQDPLMRSSLPEQLIIDHDFPSRSQASNLSNPKRFGEPNKRLTETEFYSGGPSETSSASNEFESASSDIHNNECDTNFIKLNPPAIPEAGYHFCLVCHIVDPSEFYIHLLTEETSQLDDIQEQLSLYSEVPWTHLPFNLSLYVDTFWAAPHPSDKAWYRIRIVQVHNSNQKIEDIESLKKVQLFIQYIDYGNFGETTLGELRPLKGDLINYPAIAVKCSLAKVQPLEEAWTDECIQCFEKLSGLYDENTVTIYLTERPSNDNFESPLEIFLWNSDLNKGKDVLVNAELVHKNYAHTKSLDWILEDVTSDKGSPDGVGAKLPPLGIRKTMKATLNSYDTSNRLIEEDESDDEWDPLRDDYNNPNNKYGYDPDNPSIVTLGYKTKNLDKICHYFKEGYCKYDEDCIYKHLTQKEINELDSEEVVIQPIKAYGIKIGSTLQVIVTFIESPYLFYVVPKQNNSICCNIRDVEYSTSEYKLSDYNKMTQDMKLFYKKPDYYENLDIFPALGSLVAIEDGGKFWRGRVIRINLEQSQCLVQNIDTGSSEIIERKFIFNLHISFATLPALALQCCLADIGPPNDDYKWPIETIKRFQELALSKTFDARVFMIDPEDKISMTLFNVGKEKGEDIVIADILVQEKLAKSIAKR